MSSATKVSSAVSSRYAIALIELAQEAKNIEKVEKDLQDMAAMLAQSPDLSRVVKAPSFNPAQQQAAMSAVAEKAGFQDLTRNFLGVLVQNRRLYALEAIIEGVYAELAKRRGEITVEVTAAQDLSDKQVKALQQAIAKGVGRDVSLKAHVEPGILGGLVVTVGSQMIDNSVRRKLERLKLAMSRQSNQNLGQSKGKKAKEA